MKKKCGHLRQALAQPLQVLCRRGKVLQLLQCGRS